MSAPVHVSLPIGDRRTSLDFYRAFLDLDAPGEPADDGIPEPLQFDLNDGFRSMLIPSGGFGWVVDTGAQLASRGTISALVILSRPTPEDVDEVTRRADQAGGSVLRTARQEEWGYCSLVADPDGHVWQVIAPRG